MRIQTLQNFARSNIMWTATWALNTLIAKGKSTDWMVHMLGQSAGAYTDATHGMTLSAVSLPYYRYIMPYGLAKFCRFAVNVWGVDANEKSSYKFFWNIDTMSDLFSMCASFSAKGNGIERIREKSGCRIY